VANGAVTPYKIKFTATAIDVADLAQPNSSSKGTSITPTDERNAAEVNSTKNVTAATSHARCHRFTGGA
jgi:hypothetical protein